MNDLPHFEPNQLASVQLSSVRLNKITIGQTASQIQPGVRVRSSRTPGGTTLSVPKTRTPSPVYPNLWVSAPFRSGEGFKVRITPGYLTYQLLLKKDDAGGPLYYDTPTIDAVSIETTPPPELALPANTCKIYMHCTTNNRGVPTMTPEIVATTDEQTSIHHVPESTSTTPPVDGDYYWLLAEIEEVPESDPVSVTVKRRFPGDKFIPNQLVRIKNIGGEVEAYKRFDDVEDVHEFRTLKNIGSTGIPVLQDDEDPPGNTLNFRKIDAASGSPLQVKNAGDIITVEGNGYAGPATGIVKNMTTVDGLVSVYETSAGWWGQCMFIDGGGNSVMRQTFEDGQLVLVEKQKSGDPTGWEPVSGTEVSPGLATVVVSG